MLSKNYSIRKFKLFYLLRSVSVEEPATDKISNKIKGLWKRFDENVMKPFFIADWPFVKEDHDEISRKIIALFEEHQRRKIKNKELKDMTTKGNQDKIESLLVEDSRNVNVRRKSSGSKRMPN